ncbi:MAG: hypothetical protein ACR2K0_07965, partial [Acidimicrobiales bacterium]
TAKASVMIFGSRVSVIVGSIDVLAFPLAVVTISHRPALPLPLGPGPSLSVICVGRCAWAAGKQQYPRRAAPMRSHRSAGLCTAAP